MPITLTDAEQAFADSPKGKMLVARERTRHNTREAHKGARAIAWTDAMEAEAVRLLATHEVRSAVATAAVLADAARQAPIARAARDTARAVVKEQTRTAYLGNR